jgi:PLP dependent protein
MINPVEIESRLEVVNGRIENAKSDSGLKNEQITLIAVSKTFPAKYCSKAIACGVTDLGESRIQDTESKIDQVKGSARWHLIGHLQSNKVAKALKLYDLIQSVDSYKLAETISNKAEREFEILVQINSSGEESKFGFSTDEAQDEILKIAELNNIKIMGLMTIGPYVTDETAIRASFTKVRDIFENLKRFENDKMIMKHLSMGMSGDFELAIKEGANMIRIGSLIFGPRGL